MSRADQIFLGVVLTNTDTAVGGLNAGDLVTLDTNFSAAVHKTTVAGSSNVIGVVVTGAAQNSKVVIGGFPGQRLNVNCTTGQVAAVGDKVVSSAFAGLATINNGASSDQIFGTVLTAKTAGLGNTLDVLFTTLAAAGGGAGAGSGKALIDGTDTTADYLAAKLVAGSGIVLTVQNSGGNETILISNTAIAPINATYLVKTIGGSGLTNAIAADTLGGPGFLKAAANGTFSIDTNTYQVTLTTASGANLTPKFIVQGTSAAGLTNAQFLGALATGFVRVTTTTGVLTSDTNTYLTTTVAGTTYEPIFALTNKSVIVSTGGAGVTEDNANFNFDTSTHKLLVNALRISGLTAGFVKTDSSGNTSVDTNTYLNATNNLSDLVSASAARTNLGLVAIASTGSAADLVAGILPAARFPALTGDVTTTAGAVATTLATVNSNVGTFADATITVNAKGLVTAASAGPPIVVGTPGTYDVVTTNTAGEVTSGVPAIPLLVAGSFVVATLDGVSGNDATGVIGISSASQAAALAAALPFKTFAALYAVLSQSGNGAQLTILVKGGSYAEAFKLHVDNYSNVTFRGSDLTDSAGDRITCQTTTATGCNVAGYDATGTPTALNIPALLHGGGAVTFTAEPGLLGFRLRFDSATTTGALQGIIRNVVANGTGDITVDIALPAIPVTGDRFYLEMATVAPTSVTIGGNSGNAAAIHLVGLAPTGSITVSATNYGVLMVCCLVGSSLSVQSRQWNGTNIYVPLIGGSAVSVGDSRVVTTAFFTNCVSAANTSTCILSSVTYTRCLSISALNVYYGGIVTYSNCLTIPVNGGYAIGVNPLAPTPTNTPARCLNTVSIRNSDVAFGNSFHNPPTNTPSFDCTGNGNRVSWDGTYATIPGSLTYFLSLSRVVSFSPFYASYATNCSFFFGPAAIVTNGSVTLNGSGNRALDINTLAFVTLRDETGNAFIGSAGSGVANIAQYNFPGNAGGTIAYMVCRLNGTTDTVVAAQADTAPHAANVIGVNLCNPGGLFTTIQPEITYVGAVPIFTTESSPTIPGPCWLSDVTAGAVVTTAPTIAKYVGQVLKDLGSYTHPAAGAGRLLLVELNVTTDPVSAGITQLTTDVTAGPGSGSQVATISAGAVTLAKMANIATASFIGRITAGTGVPQALTAANAWTILGVEPAANFPALTGDITTTAGALATTLATVNSNVGTFANATITVNGKGLITAASAGTSGADPLGWYIVTRTANKPTNALDLSGLVTGLVKSTITGGNAIISIDTTAYLSQAYTTIAAAGTARTQRSTLNFTTNFTAVDNVGLTRTDVDLSVIGSITPGAYTFSNITVDANGRITLISSGTVASTNSHYVVTQLESSLPNSTNLGGLASGFVKSSVTTGISTIVIDTTSYLPTFSLTNKSVLISSGGTGVTEDNANFQFDTATHKLTTNALRISGLTAGFVKTDSSGNTSVDNSTYLTTALAASTYQPILSLTNTDVLFATGGNTVGQDANFSYNSTTHVLSVPSVSAVGAGSLTLRSAAVSLIFNNGPATITLSGGFDVQGVTGAGSIGEALTFSKTGDQAITKTGGVLYLATNDAHSLAFVTNGTARGNFDISGNLNLTVNALPTTTLTYDLGSASKLWTTAWVQQVQSGSNGLTLQDSSSANTSVYLSNTAITTTGNILPSPNNTYNLGSVIHKWANLWATNLNIDNLVAANSLNLTANNGSVNLSTTTGTISFFSSGNGYVFGNGDISMCGPGGNVLMFATLGAPNMHGAGQTLYIESTANVPSAAPATGVYLYVSAGSLIARTANGTYTLAF